MNKLITYLLIFIFFGIFAPTDAFACSCLQPEKTEVARDWLNNFKGAVFEGRVAKIEKADSEFLVKVTFRVERYWKGVSDPQAYVYTASNSAMCGVTFEPGKSYLVIADSNNGRFNVNLCSWLTYQKNEAAYRARLGKGKKPKGKRT